MNTATNHQLLLVDDDPISLKIMHSLLTQAGFSCVTAEDAHQAAAQLDAYPVEHFSAILLDNQMPGKTGLELLQDIKQGPHTHLPVIMQTGSNSPDEVHQCIAAGAFYYLTKPLDRQLLLSVVEAAISDLENHRAVRAEMSQIDQSLELLHQACFQFRTPRDATLLSAFLARLGNNPDKVSIGLYELLINAVEHGNLGISYDEKTRLIETQQLKEEINRRLEQPQFKDRLARVTLMRNPESLVFTIEDQGAGFDFEQYLEFSLDRALDNHGRGIMVASKISFDHLQYSQGGRCVTATHLL
ncbi:response regulator [Marinospirillum alkaliphilum]|uniref:Histidine kinase-like ATPase domain-containing protein n=1 Tax=Marinospirillum alkaliphilum DSM 21637 TaxID=1122209 RepID=A0A1K1X223_9GAMM|nr:response regulator [Marinospirillum alkaliphilum]SFX43706.1 Histidine kinase-like ATPase domain-containing protein [Marinospirillum alkaliphilum DSM 21637]